MIARAAQAERLSLRGYQQDAHDAALDALDVEDSTLLVMPTGTGKTRTFSAIASTWREAQGGPVLCVAHRAEIVEQNTRALEAAGLGVSVEMADSRASMHGALFGQADAVSASIQSMARRLKHYDRDAFGLLIMDEAHHVVPGSQYADVREYFASAKLLGVTATPDRLDKRGLGALFASCAYTYEIREAIKSGFLVPIKQQLVHVDGLDFSKVRTVAGDLNEGQLDAIMREDGALHGIAGPAVRLTEGRPTLVFAVSVEHAHALAAVLEMYGGAGCAVALDGTTARDERRETLRRFAAGEIRFLVNCLDEQTEILSSRGWVGIDSIADDEMVATMGAGSAVEWQRIERVVRRDRAADERMVCIKNQTLDVRVTEGHRMLVRAPGAKGWQVHEAGTLTTRGGAFMLPLAAIDSQPRVEAAPADATPVSALSLDDCRFIGLWMSDGHLDRTGGHRGITIGQSARYVGANQSIERILTGCGFDWRRTTIRVDRSIHEQHRYSVPKGSIGGQLARRGFARLLPYLDKDMSPLLFGLTWQQTAALIEGLWLGDGVKEEHRVRRGSVRRSWRIVNTNKTMLDRLQALTVTRGFAANISPPRDNGPLATKSIYTIGIRERAAVCTNNHTIATSGGNPARFESGWRAERVWCVTTPNGTIITRRNGKAIVMGQCALFTEGTDIPSASAAVMARPTASRALYAQMVGRVLRTHPGKSDALVLDFAGNAGKHSLVLAAQVLGADVTPEVAARVAKRAAETGDDVQTVMDELAEIDRVAELKRRAVQVRAKVRVQDIDPFAVLGLTRHDGRSTMRPTERQQLALERIGLKPQDVDAMDRRSASDFLDAVSRARREGMATFKQQRFLMSRGLRSDLTFAEAGKVMDAIASNRWQVPADVLAKYSAVA